MDLNQLAKNLISSRPGPRYGYERFPEEFVPRGFFSGNIEQTIGFERLFHQVGNEGSTRAILSSLFWDIFTSSKVFDRMLRTQNIENPLLIGGKLILTMQPDMEGNHRFDLLILSPQISLERSFVTYLYDELNYQLGRPPLHWGNGDTVGYFPFNEEAYRDRKHKELSREGYEDQSKLLQYISTVSNPEVIRDLQYQNFRIIFAPMPKTEFAAGIPSPACGIALEDGGIGNSSAGVVARNSEGRIGVTGAFHGMDSNPSRLSQEYHLRGVSCLVGKKVYVGGVKGEIIDADEITDSCFITIDEREIPPCIPYTGILSQRPPYKTEPVYFEGITSKVSTNITEIDVGIPAVSPGRQRCVYTKPVTNRGDSGSALVNNQGEVVGFSFRRTGYGEVIEYSEWIWADSVFKAFQLSKP